MPHLGAYHAFEVEGKERARHLPFLARLLKALPQHGLAESLESFPPRCGASNARWPLVSYELTRPVARLIFRAENPGDILRESRERSLFYHDCQRFYGAYMAH